LAGKLPAVREGEQKKREKKKKAWIWVGGGEGRVAIETTDLAATQKAQPKKRS